ncbi:helix-turn-helix domain-containing protein [Streptomyces spectabilis]|uniref:Helix-turn-helix domain-containing protein n=1 Tax=Streptomyces spectabilis TaxID=68270 RepID=A0A516RJR5_STRST|nr:helix-turn-helix transcriptional regulator [Streptomyces spectabilis]QDQ15902.1 helix-turn-helix domain-containing protein [Streptomyces spectabilis]
MAQAPRASPTIAHRVLARRLQRVRVEQARLSPAQAALLVGTTHMTIRRIESAATSINIVQIEQLLQAYGVRGDALRTLLEQARQAAEPGWWHHRYRRVMSAAYQHWIALESDASAIRLWAPGHVPGLLQIPAYTAALHRALHPGAPAAHTDLAVELVHERQQRQRQRGARLWTVLSAAALHPVVGGPGVRRAQHQALEAGLAEPRTALQVLPLDTAPYPLLGAPPVRHLRVDADIPDHVVEHRPFATTITDDEDTVARWRQALDGTAAAATWPTTLTPHLPPEKTSPG